MSLKQLAGPFPVVNGETNLIPISSLNRLFWHPGMGCLSEIRFAVTPATLHKSLITLDGVEQDIGGDTASEGTVTLGWGWWEQAKRQVALILKSGITSEWAYDSRALIREPTLNGASAAIGQSYMRLATTWLTYSSGAVREVNAAGVSVVTHPPVSNLFSCTIGPGRGYGEIFIGETSTLPSSDFNRCCFYNYLTKEITSPIFWLPIVAHRLAYASDFGVIISAQEEDIGDGDQWTFRIWSLETVPVEVTVPVQIGGNVQVGSKATFRVQALGDQGEPIPNELISWSLTGVGTLLDNQSTTDSNGYATTQVHYGLDDGDEDSTVKATLIC